MRREGYEIPKVEFIFREAGEFVTRTSADLFRGKRVVIFSLPGAFTPTCSAYQLPGFEEKYTTDRIIKLDAFDFPVAYFYNAVAQMNLQNLDAAEKSAQEAVKLDTQHRFPKASHLLGIILAQKGDFAGATKHLKGYLSMLAPNAQETDLVKKQIAEVERLMGSAGPAAAPNP